MPRPSYQHVVTAQNTALSSGRAGVRLRGLQLVGVVALIKSDVDILDGTPLLDIKPFNPAIDHRAGCRVGWMQGRFEARDELVSDDRFAREET